VDTQTGNKFNFRIATLVSLAIMCVVMLWVSKDFGITGDEYTQNTYGQKVFDYYASFGKDKSCLSYSNVYYYGGMFDMLCVVVNKVVHLDEYNVRHFIIAICGFLMILVSSLLAKEFKGWGAGFLTAWFLFLSPRMFGESMNNPKDVPFALSMILGIYFIYRFLRAFPKPTWKDSLWLALSIGLAIEIRIGGLLLIPFLAVGVALQYFFEWRKQYSLGSAEVRKYAIRCIVVCIVGYIAGLIFWPYGLEGPVDHPLVALGEMSKFATGIRMLFDDNHIMSSNIPWYYIPKWITITSPIIVLVGIYASPVLFFLKKFKFHELAFLFFVALFPLVYVIYKKSPLYDGWRHMLFIYPALVVLGALTFSTVMEMIRAKAGKYALAAVIALGLLLPARWSIANHPNEIVYFNELQGGIDGAFGYYETDYYMNGLKQAAYKLAKEKDLYNIKDTVRIGTNCVNPLWHYVSTINPKIQCVYVRYPQRYEKKWDYGLFYSRFLSKDLLQNGYFPSADAFDVIKADHTPLYSICKWTDADNNVFLAHEALQAKDVANACAYYEKALAADPKNETIYDNYAIALYSSQTMEGVKKALDVINRALKADPSDIQAYQIAVALYNATGDKEHAQQAEATMNELIMKEREGQEEE
jgi:tetratricopeptide (TPR) repeat protein